jgi:hypothetical protein
MPLGSVHTISVSAHCLRQLVSVWIGRMSECTLLPLVAIVARNPCLEQHALGVVFGLDKDAGFVVLRCSVSAHCHWVVVDGTEPNLRPRAGRRRSQCRGHTSRCS